MKKFFLSLLLTAALFTNVNLAQTANGKQALPKNTAAATVKPRQDFAVPFVNKTLPNGLEVIVLPDSGVPIVTVELAVRNGSFTETPELNGLSHLYEHMFFKPNQAAFLLQCEALILTGGANSVCDSPLKSKRLIGDVSYLRNIDTLGITYNGSTREEVVNYYFTTTSPYLSTAIRVINDAVRFPVFEDKEFENEKQVVIGELDRNLSNPSYYLSREMTDKLYYKYPSRKNPGGTRETVAAATTDQMRTIQSRYYFPNNAALIVTGDVKPEEVFKAVEQVMGSWERRAVDPFKEFPLVDHPPLTKNEAVVIEKNTGEETQSAEQNVFIQVGWHGPSIGKDDKSTYAADVFSYILSQPDSRFQRNLVDSGLTVGANVNYYTQRNVGPITLSLVTTPEKAKAAIKAAYAEVAQFASPGYFTNEELENSKTILESNDLFEREKSSEYAHTLGFWWSSTGIDYFRGYHKNLRATSRADINKYITTYIADKNHVGIALLSPGAKTRASLTDQDLIGGK
ncbi:MAG: insulinase family protein [Saprospiraceae bacterium]|nr:insulinase family protein [Pyrinomonadaceae bacterium]